MLYFLSWYLLSGIASSRSVQYDFQHEHRRLDLFRSQHVRRWLEREQERTTLFSNQRCGKPEFLVILRGKSSREWSAQPARCLPPKVTGFYLS